MMYEEVAKSGLWEAGNNRATYIIVKTTYQGSEDVDYRLFGYTWDDEDSPDLDVDFTVINVDDLTPAQIHAGVQGSSVQMSLSFGEDSSATFPAELFGVYATKDEAKTAMDNLKMIEGCRDPLATNYNKNANIAGSCNYPDDESLPWGIIMVAAVGIGLFTII